MTLFTVDTNVLVYAAADDLPHHARARTLIETWRAGDESWYVAWPTMYEFARVVTHPRILRRPWTFAQAWEYVGALLNSPAVRVMTETTGHLELVRETSTGPAQVAGNLVHDLHLTAMMREHGVSTVYTADSAYSIFRQIKVVNPFA